MQEVLGSIPSSALFAVLLLFIWLFCVLVCARFVVGAILGLWEERQGGMASPTSCRGSFVSCTEGLATVLCIMIGCHDQRWPILNFIFFLNLDIDILFLSLPVLLGKDWPR